MQPVRWRGWLWGVLGGFCTALVLFATSRYGPGYNPDAVTALATARNLLEEGVFFSHFSLYVRWPPLFPLLQSGLSSLGLGPMVVARWTNALSYGGLVAGMGILIFQTTRSQAGRVLGGASALVSFPLFRQAVEASTEPLFAVFVLLFVVQGGRYLRRPTGKQVALLSVWVAFACLQRYAGVALLACGGLLLLCQQSIAAGRWVFPSTDAWRHTTTFGVGAVAPLGAWLLRNVLMSGTLTGPRFTTNHTLGESLRALVDAIISWVIPIPFSALVRGGVVATVIASLLYVAVRQTEESAKPGGRRELEWACWMFLGVYVLMVTITGAIGASELPSRRLLMPAFPPAFLLGIWGIDVAYGSLSEAGKSWGYRGVLFAHVSWILGMALLIIIYALVRSSIGGGGYNTESWQTSETAEWVRNHRLRKLVRSNEEHALYFLTSVPQREPESGAIPHQTKSFSLRFPTEGYYIVCFDRPQRARLHPRRIVEQLGDFIPSVSRIEESVPDLPKRNSKIRDCSKLVAPTADVDTVRSLSDGSIYEVYSVPSKLDKVSPLSSDSRP